MSKVPGKKASKGCKGQIDR